MKHLILNKYFVILTVMCAVLVMSNNASAAFRTPVDKQSIIKELINAPQCPEFDYLLDRYCSAGRADGQNGRAKVIKGEDIERKYIKITSDLSIIFKEDQGYLYDTNNPLLLKEEDLSLSCNWILLAIFCPMIIMFIIITASSSVRVKNDIDLESVVSLISLSIIILAPMFILCLCSMKAGEIEDKMSETSLYRISVSELEMVRNARFYKTALNCESAEKQGYIQKFRGVRMRQADNAGTPDKKVLITSGDETEKAMIEVTRSAPGNYHSEVKEVVIEKKIPVKLKLWRNIC